jgi:hypothetical protein
MIYCDEAIRRKGSGFGVQERTEPPTDHTDKHRLRASALTTKHAKGHENCKTPRQLTWMDRMGRIKSRNVSRKGAKGAKMDSRQHSEFNYENCERGRKKREGLTIRFADDNGADGGGAWGVTLWRYPPRVALARREGWRRRAIASRLMPEGMVTSFRTCHVRQVGRAPLLPQYPESNPYDCRLEDSPNHEWSPRVRFAHDQLCDAQGREVEDEKDQIPERGELCAQKLKPMEVAIHRLATENEKPDDRRNERQMRNHQRNRKPCPLRHVEFFDHKILANRIHQPDFRIYGITPELRRVRPCLACDLTPNPDGGQADWCGWTKWTGWTVVRRILLHFVRWCFLLFPPVDKRRFLCGRICGAFAGYDSLPTERFFLIRPCEFDNISSIGKLHKHNITRYGIGVM